MGRDKKNIMITCVILFHNEAGTIKRCIDSVLWCDEIIVVDDQSATNARKQIPDRKNIHVYVRRLEDDFSEQRNFGLEKANGEWVLFVDADEVVPPALKKEIMHITSPQPSPAPSSLKLRRSSRRGSEIKGYALKRRDYFLGTWLEHGETSAVRLVRLGKKNAGVWEGNVHETWNIQGTVGELESPLSHYPHKTISEFLESINRYTDAITRRSSRLIQEHVQNLKGASSRSRLSRDENESIRIVVYPIGKFFQNYILRMGFLDGVPGLIMATMMSFHSFLVRAKRWEKE